MQGPDILINPRDRLPQVESLGDEFPGQISGCSFDRYSEPLRPRCRQRTVRHCLCSA